VSAGHHHALELLERALAYTRMTLSSVGSDRSGPTPCARWTLADLLVHMDDGLDAFLEAAGGAVHVEVPQQPGADLAVLKSKACDLLGAWSSRPPARVLIGERELPQELVVSAAALEIAVHGWDVCQATGYWRVVPDELARALVAVARTVVTEDDRPHRFAGAVPPAPGTGAAGELLGFLGRVDLRG